MPLILEGIMSLSELVATNVVPFSKAFSVKLVTATTSHGDTLCHNVKMYFFFLLS